MCSGSVLVAVPKEDFDRIADKFPSSLQQIAHSSEINFGIFIKFYRYTLPNPLIRHDLRG